MRSVKHSYKLDSVSFLFRHSDVGPLSRRNSFSFSSFFSHFDSFCRSFSLDYDSVPVSADSVYLHAYNDLNYGIRYVVKFGSPSPDFYFVLNPSVNKLFVSWLSSFNCEIPF